MRGISGMLIAKRFRVGNVIGKGGMAIVYEALDTRSNQPVAIKTLRTDHAKRPEALSRFEREAAILSKLDHPSIVRAIDYGTFGKSGVFIAMELLRGETLRAWIESHHHPPPSEVLKLVEPLTAALASAHQSGIVHRDLKPENIFLTPRTEANGESTTDVRILDFGVSKLYEGPRITRTGEILGTPLYMAPEQLTAERDIDARADVYALGVICYEMLTGRPPFVARLSHELLGAILRGLRTPLSERRADLPDAIQHVIDHAMSMHKEERFETVRALYNALSGVLM